MKTLQRAIDYVRRLPLFAPLIAFLSSERVVAGILIALIDGALLMVPQARPHLPLIIQLSVALWVWFTALHTYVKLSAKQAEGAPGTSPDVNPLIEPLLKLLHSRKFLLTVAGLVADAAIIILPQFERQRDQLLALVNGLLVYYTGLIAHEDAKSVEFFQSVRDANPAV